MAARGRSHGALGVAVVAGLALAAGVACVPVHPTAGQLVGRWRVTWACGTERLELRADSTYVQEATFAAAGSQMRHGGRWHVERGSSLDGGMVVLERGLVFCEPSGARVDRPRPEDVRLTTTWEWGRMVLEFNPDIQGFEREPS